MFIVWFERVGIGGVVIGDDDGVIVDAEVAIEAGQEIARGVACCPVAVGIVET